MMNSSFHYRFSATLITAAASIFLNQLHDPVSSEEEKRIFYRLQEIIQAQASGDEERPSYVYVQGKDLHLLHSGAEDITLYLYPTEHILIEGPDSALSLYTVDCNPRQVISHASQLRLSGLVVEREHVQLEVAIFPVVCADGTCGLLLGKELYFPPTKTTPIFLYDHQILDLRNDAGPLYRCDKESCVEPITYPEIEMLIVNAEPYFIDFSLGQ